MDRTHTKPSRPHIDSSVAIARPAWVCTSLPHAGCVTAALAAEAARSTWQICMAMLPISLTLAPSEPSYNSPCLPFLFSHTHASLHPTPHSHTHTHGRRHTYAHIKTHLQRRGAVPGAWAVEHSLQRPQCCAALRRQPGVLGASKNSNQHELIIEDLLATSRTNP
jgi:hypothetical protein